MPPGPNSGGGGTADFRFQFNGRSRSQQAAREEEKRKAIESLTTYLVQTLQREKRAKRAHQDHSRMGLLPQGSHDACLWSESADWAGDPLSMDASSADIGSVFAAYLEPESTMATEATHGAAGAGAAPRNHLSPSALRGLSSADANYGAALQPSSSVTASTSAGGSATSAARQRRGGGHGRGDRDRDRDHIAYGSDADRDRMGAGPSSHGHAHGAVLDRERGDPAPGAGMGMGPGALGGGTGRAGGDVRCAEAPFRLWWTQSMLGSDVMVYLTIIACVVALHRWQNIMAVSSAAADGVPAGARLPLAPVTAIHTASAMMPAALLVLLAGAPRVYALHRHALAGWYRLIQALLFVPLRYLDTRSPLVQPDAPAMLRLLLPSGCLPLLALALGLQIPMEWQFLLLSINASSNCLGAAITCNAETAPESAELWECSSTQRLLLPVATYTLVGFALPCGLAAWRETCARKRFASTMMFKQSVGELEDRDYND